MENNILLESGTNEVEILEFICGSNRYGINIAKVREIIKYETVTPVANCHKDIEGIFVPRDVVLTTIDLAKNLNLDYEPNPKKDMLIITNFNKLDVAFHVQAVIGIHRVSWTDIIIPEEDSDSTVKEIATGLIEVEGRKIVILDFEKIVTNISPETGINIAEIDELGERNRNEVPIVIAEDSPLLSSLILDSLSKAGYTNVKSTANGQEAWDYITECKEKGTVATDVKLVITDIEMPIMDGHHLIKCIKSDNDTKNIPVVIFSSLVNEEMKRKGESLGADGQLSKPEIGNLVRIIDDLLAK